MEKLEFVFQLVLYAKVLMTTNVVTKALQQPGVELSEANILLKQAHQELQEFRNNCEAAKETAIQLSAHWGVKVEFCNKRIKKTKKYFEELCEEKRLTDGEVRRFLVNIFYRCLDIISNELRSRFSS